MTHPPSRGIVPDRLSAALVCAVLFATLVSCGGAKEPSGSAGGAPTPTPEPGAPAAPAAGGAPGDYVVAAVSDGGTIRGRVLYKGAPRPPKPIEPTKDRAVCGKVGHTSEDLLVGKDGGVRNAVVSIESIGRGKAWPQAAKPTLDQHGCWFIPHVQVVPAGSEIDIINSDGILHNIHTYPKNNPPSNVAQPKFKRVINLSFAKPDVVGVKCDVHSWMSAFIVVAGNPYFAVTDETGSFSLTDVPPGSYTLATWHESLGARSMPVSVTPGGTAEASVEFQE